MAGGDHGTLRLWDVTTGKQRPSFKGGEDQSVASIAWAPDGRTVYAATFVGAKEAKCRVLNLRLRHSGAKHAKRPHKIIGAG